MARPSIIGHSNWAQFPKTGSCILQDGSCALHDRRRPQAPSRGKSLAEVRPDIAAILDENLTGFGATDVSYGSSTALCIWRCETGEHTWCASPNTLTNARGGERCSICAGKVIIPERSLAAAAPWLATGWDTEANSGLSPWQVAPNDNRLYRWTCPVATDHRWKASPNNRYGKGSRCRCRGLQPGRLTHGADIEADWIC